MLAEVALSQNYRDHLSFFETRRTSNMGILMGTAFRHFSFFKWMENVVIILWFYGGVPKTDRYESFDEILFESIGFGETPTALTILFLVNPFHSLHLTWHIIVAFVANLQHYWCYFPSFETIPTFLGSVLTDYYCYVAEDLKTSSIGQMTWLGYRLLVEVPQW